ncbi:radical SAM protein [Desulfobotulus sp. H1]|uniref:Radical SAM protein n=1 Tax=Desulfobotulus pelophilus TaxID=2823377 RepID=A0ABT3NAW0_9BACT|nr:radical SAM protein [Desulfobotulus pelophilus]MCW7754604.1 radical SAM protein [Desulfobotulus pelophilus]
MVISIGKPFIIPLFLPHAACPRHCLFCNQKALHAEDFLLDMHALRRERDRWLAFPRNRQRPLELAFFGGNFLGLGESRLRACMDLVTEVPGAGVRFSTRPDTVSEDSVRICKKAGRPVTVELGIQSLDEAVLRRSARGHGVAEVARAVQVLKDAGIRTGAQMMLGLPGATESSDMASAESLCVLSPDFARVAPTLVLGGSGLALLYRRGAYKPMSFGEAVLRSARYVDLLEKRGVPVVRIGLQTDTFLENSIVAGPHHPAFGEWVRGRMLADRVLVVLASMGPFFAGEEVCIRAADSIRGRMQGMKKSNFPLFCKAVAPASLRIRTDAGLPPGFWQVEHRGNLTGPA